MESSLASEGAKANGKWEMGREKGITVALLDKLSFHAKTLDKELHPGASWSGLRRASERDGDAVEATVYE